MRIAIYENNYEDAQKLKNLIYNYCNYKKIDSVVDVYQNGDSLLSSNNNYVLTFLSLENSDGKATIQKLNYNHTGQMIITASDCRLAADAFRINAYSFLLKPFEKNRLFEILENFFNTVISTSLLLINNCYETFCVRVCDILYLEANNKHCIIHLTDKSIYCNKTMAKVFSVLPQFDFLKINRAFIVNSNHIISFNSENVVLSNKESLHPSRHFYTSFKTDYIRIKNPNIP